MAKQRRPPSRSPETGEGQSQESTESRGRSNAALQESLGGGSTEAVPLDLIRDAAVPMIDHAILALQLQALPAAELARYTEVLQSSRLPEDHRRALEDRLRADASVADVVARTVASVAGEDGPEARGALIDALAAVEDALVSGSAADSGWSAGSAVVDLGADALEGERHQRVRALIRDVAEQVAVLDVAAEGPGAAVTRVVLALAVLMLEDEEEDELGAPGDYAAEESGT